MHLGERIKQLRKERGWQQKELALKLGCPQSTVSMWETKKQEPNSRMRKKICEIFGITEAELFNASSIKETSATTSVPILTWPQIVQLSGLSNQCLPKTISESYVYTSIEEENIFALEVIDDTMHPEFREEDIIIITPCEKISTNDYFVVLEESTKNSFLRQIKNYGSKTILHPLNPKYPDIELDSKTHEIIGKVVEKLKKY